MRHRKTGRTLGRSPSHRKAMLRNMASSLFLTERDSQYDENAPKVKGRIVTTLHKAKELRPLVEKCITIARKSLAAQSDAEQYASDSNRGSDEWRTWRKSETWQRWAHAMAPAVTARRHALRLLGDKQAVKILFDEIAPRMADRHGGYTRIMRLASPRLGDAGPQAILEFVGTHDRVKIKSEKPEFAEDLTDDDDMPAEEEGPEITDETDVDEPEESSSDDVESK